ncbi:MAG: response regulator [Lutibacter sp.]|nr:response regulator [Lutibacter sp.]MDP3945255.1 response regulator [Lutibacter sp.]
MKKILIVDDDFASQLMLEIMLEDYCKFPLIATNGMVAVRLCKENPDIDIILMDIKMPELDGYQATKKIREFNKDIIIIAQTSYAFPEDREKAINAGCNDYLSKPYNQSDLMELLKKWTNNIMIL